MKRSGALAPFDKGMPMRMKVYWQSAFLLLPLLVLGCQARVVVHARPVVQEEGIEGWEHRHPEASRELGQWVRTHPEAAERFFDWDSHHPGAAKAFVGWASHHPGENIDAFARTHREWDEFNWIMEHRRPAANGFMQWCRRYPEASERLMNYPAGLHWAGHHTYQNDWGPGRITN